MRTCRTAARPEILQAVANQEWNKGRNWSGLHTQRGDDVCSGLYLSHPIARFAVKVPREFVFEGLEVLVSPMDFESHAIK